ncbi:MAG: hypothetical protein ACTHU0_34615 [Kofleriaceae bacterium]
MRHAVTTSSLLGLATVLLAGCPDRTISEVNPQQGRVEYKDIPITINRNVDILFVIDDSGSMADKQTNIRNNFTNFINVLSTIPGGLPDVHIGVVSSDVGTKTTGGQGPNVQGCPGSGKNGVLQLGMASTEVNGNYISDIRQSDGSRQTNYTGDLAQVFGRMATIGNGGCGFEQHLEAMRLALSNTTQNANFLRPDAYLAVIFLADEDDCSASNPALFGPESPAMGPLQSFRCNRFGHTCAVGGATDAQMNQIGTKGQCAPNESSPYLEKVGTYVNFLKGLKPADSNKVIVAGILGNTEPYQVELRAPQSGASPIPSVAHSCSYQGATGPEVADPAIRIKFLMDQFPNRSTFTTICQQDLSGGLQLIAQLLKTVIGDPCIEGTLADVDPVTPGEQFDCSVSWVTNQGKPEQTERVLPACNSDTNPSNTPCWRIEVDQTNCTAAPHRKLKVERGNETPPPETHEVAYCVTEAV